MNLGKTDRALKGIYYRSWMKEAPYYARIYLNGTEKFLPFKTLEGAKAARKKPCKPKKKTTRGTRLDKGLYCDPSQLKPYSVRTYSVGPNGKQKERVKRFHTEAEARNALEKGWKEKANITLGEMAELTRNYHIERKAPRLDVPLNRLKEIEDFFGSSLLASKVGGLIPSFREYLDQRLKIDGTGLLSSTTKRKILEQLKQCFAIAVKAKHFPLEEVPEIPLYPARKDGVPCDLDWKTFWKVMNAVDTDKKNKSYPQRKTIKAMMIYIFYYGPRLNDALHAKWTDIKDGNLAFCSSKTDREFMRLMPEPLMEELENLPRLGPYMFANPKTGEPFTGVYRHLDAMCAHAGVKKKIRPHMLRHLCADNIFHLTGGDIKAVANWVGWGKEKMAQYYLTIRSVPILSELNTLVSMAKNGKPINPWEKKQSNTLSLLEQASQQMMKGDCDFEELAILAERIAKVARSLNEMPA